MIVGLNERGPAFLHPEEPEATLSFSKNLHIFPIRSGQSGSAAPSVFNWAVSRTKWNGLMNRSGFGMVQVVDNFAVDFQWTAKAEHFARAVIHLEGNGIELLLGDL